MSKPLMLLNRQNTKQALLTDWEGTPAPKQVSGEAIAWINEVVTAVCRNLVVSGRRSPSGRLMAPKSNAEFMARHILKTEPPVAESAATPNTPEEWGPYPEWQLERRSEKTKLTFEEWKRKRST